MFQVFHALVTERAGRPSRPRGARQAGGLRRRPRVPHPREVRQPGLAHAPVGAAGRRHRQHRVGGEHSMAREPIILIRDVEATFIPQGGVAVVPGGTWLVMQQALGGSFTLMTERGPAGARGRQGRRRARRPVPGRGRGDRLGAGRLAGGAVRRAEDLDGAEGRLRPGDPGLDRGAGAGLLGGQRAGRGRPPGAGPHDADRARLRRGADAGRRREAQVPLGAGGEGRPTWSWSSTRRGIRRG